MLEIQTSTELLLTNLIWFMGFCTLVLGLTLIYVGRKLMAALDDVTSVLSTNLQAITANVGLAVTALQSGGVTPAQISALQAVADGMKTANNALAGAVTGGQVL